MTAHAMKGDREECLAAGMDGYVSKPIRRHELERVIQNVLTSQPEIINPPERTNGSSRPQSDKVDWDDALETASGNVELLREVSASFLEETPCLLAQMEEAVRNANARALKNAAHTLKGNLRIFGQSRTQELADRLENIAKTGSSESCGEMLTELCTETAAVLDEIRRHDWNHTPSQ